MMRKIGQLIHYTRHEVGVHDVSKNPTFKSPAEQSLHASSLAPLDYKAEKNIRRRDAHVVYSRHSIYHS